MSKESESKKRKTPLVKLRDYINKIYIEENREPNWAVITKQIQHIKKEYNTNETEIKLVLMYMMTVRQMNLFANMEQGSILNLVPYYIEETRQYQQFQEDVKESAKGASTKENNIVVNVNRHKLNGNRYVSDHNLTFD